MEDKLLRKLDKKFKIGVNILSEFWSTKSIDGFFSVSGNAFYGGQLILFDTNGSKERK